MPKFNSPIEVVNKVLERFENVDQLSKTDDGVWCYYSPHINGVGCAIGCLVDEKTAELWDNGGNPVEISEVSRKHLFRPSYNVYFGAGLFSTLWKLQEAHDLSPDVSIFKAKVRELQHKLMESE